MCKACVQLRFTHFCITPQTGMLGCQQDSLKATKQMKSQTVQKFKLTYDTNMWKRQF